MMNEECKSICLTKLGKLMLILLSLTPCLNRAAAQQVTPLIQFTNVWKYDQSGMELGTTWRTNDYDDSAWPSGAGLLGVDNSSPAVYPPHLTPLIVNDSLITYYFRTTFEFFGETNGVILIASNYIDDGAVIYLNGREAGRFRVSAGQISTTRSSGGNVEGALDVLSISPGLLRQGTNLMAVELHQGSVPAADLSWGMKLVASSPTALTITNHPQDKIVTFADTVVFQVGVLGGPAYYQWQREGANLVNGGSISGVNSNVLTIGGAQIIHSGAYRVLVTNAISSVTSTAAALLVVPDYIGPRLLSAVVRETSVTNEILLQFSENLQSAPVQNLSSTNILNYRVTSCTTGRDIAISNIAVSTSFVLLRIGDTNWTIGDCYRLTVNNITDRWGNRIAPGSQVSVSWPLHVNLLASDAEWSFHASAAFDPGIYDEDWTSTNYVEGEVSWWARGNGIFYGVPLVIPQCLGDLQTSTGFQPEPTLFRTTFHWPTNLGSIAQLEPDFIVDDGMVLYLNGVEIWRTNAPLGATRLTAAARSPSTIPSPTCVTNINLAVTNLLPGTNWLAVGVVQPVNDLASDLVFGLRLTATVLLSEPIQEGPIPTLNLTPNGSDAIRLWWNGGGYALESTTNLTDNSASYPFGPWLQITNMSNPYTNNLTQPSRFFRLKK